METAGLLASRWELPDPAAAAGRPRRRLYEVTGAGARAMAAWHAASAQAEAAPSGGPGGLALGGTA